MSVWQCTVALPRIALAQHVRKERPGEVDV